MVTERRINGKSKEGIMQEILDLFKDAENREAATWIIGILVTNGFLIWRKIKIEKALKQVVASVEELKREADDNVELETVRMVLGRVQDADTESTVQRIQKQLRKERKGK